MDDTPEPEPDEAPEADAPLALRSADDILAEVDSLDQGGDADDLYEHALNRARLEVAIDTRNQLADLYNAVLWAAKHVAASVDEAAKYAREIGDQLDRMPRP